MTSESVLNEFDRFKLWAGNIAAHRKASAIVQGDRIPWDEEVYSDSGSEILDDDRDIEDPQDDTEIKQLYVSIGSAITALMRISIAIREPAPNRQSRTIDKSHFEHHDMLHVQAKFPNAAQYLTERLGRAISSRRQYLTYREIHHDKLSKGIEKLGLEAARTETTTNSTEATKLQRTNSLNLLDEDDDTSSQTSYATSINATLRAPKLPKEARERDHYNCPLCFALIDIHTTAAWK
ncbi:hypothetical protein N0V94_003979 [Neodidymelliopsis sp. IMI 364377]|nr:hypothetical protein N0V94_003979 [Neodidymelliopsis sp. IMI 364377]